MVNRCIMTGCKSIYGTEKVRHHKFPMTNSETLPIWIAAANKGKNWRPNKNSKLCSNHFTAFQYQDGRGKGYLKSSAVPIMNISNNRQKNSRRFMDPGTVEQIIIIPSENDCLNLEIDQMSFAQFCKLKAYQMSVQNKSCSRLVVLDENNLNGSIKNNNNINGTETSRIQIRRIENQCFKETDKTLVSKPKPPDNKSYIELSNMSDGPTTAVSKFQTFMEFQPKRQTNN